VLVRIVTCRTLPEVDRDQELLLAALRAAGLDARLAIWDDPDETWAGGLSVIRSTWDYHLNLGAFLDWVMRAGSRSVLLNPPDVVRFSAHKRYLETLAAAGLPVLPTVHLERGTKASFSEILDGRRWKDVVVKPSVSLGSFRTARFDRGRAEEGQAYLDALVADRDVLVQPYMSSVEGYGERSVIWIDGEVTHSIRKSPRFGGQDESTSPAVEPTAEERALAERFVGHVASNGSRLLYARVDLARDEAGKPLLMELELIEPSLFLTDHPPALDSLVRAIANIARG
jgi:hypothetical protein